MIKNKIRKVLDYIIERKDEQAKAELKKIIQNHPKYLEYKKTLSEMGLDLKTADVDDKIYDGIKDTLQVFPVPVQLKILDVIYKEIKNENEAKNNAI